jgi:hypothetical protein
MSDRSESTLAGIFPLPAGRSSSRFSLGFAIRTVHALRGGDFHRRRIYWASTDMAKFIE